MVSAGNHDAPESLLAKADSAMYRAKRLGGNQVNVEDEEDADGENCPARAAP